MVDFGFRISEIGRGARRHAWGAMSSVLEWLKWVKWWVTEEEEEEAAEGEVTVRWGAGPGT